MMTDIDRSTETLAEIWRQVLGVQEVPLDEHFFDLGGHSMAFLRVGALIKQRLGVSVPLLQLLTYPTIRSLAGQITERS
jgi:acyl carrier protein